MNIYFLVEGRRCEKKLYPARISVLTPHLRQVKKLRDIKENNFFLISGEGYPSILDIHLPNAIRDVENLGLFDVLVVVLDADEETMETRRAAVEAAVGRAQPRLTSARLEIVVQFRCIETWLLGNRRMYRRNPELGELVSRSRDCPKHIRSFSRFLAICGRFS